MYLYLLAIIILIICYFIRPKHKFWDKQPVMRNNKNKNIEIIGKIPRFRFRLNSYNIIFKSNNGNLDNTYEFLNNHFSKNYNLNYNYFKYCYLSQNVKNITAYQNNEIIGFIHSKPINVVFKTKLLQINYVDYLCVDRKQRNKNLASFLIAKLLYTFRNKNSIFLFKKDDYGIPYKSIVKTHYFYKDLRKIIPNKVENAYLLKRNNSKKHKVYEYYKKLVRKFTMYNYLTRKEFYNLYASNNSLDLFDIKNRNGKYTLVIGKKIIYKMADKFENCFEIDIILGDLSNCKELDDRLSNILKNEGYNYYCLSNLGNHGKFIRENALKRSGKVYYYTYNLNLPKFKKSKFIVNLN